MVLAAAYITDYNRRNRCVGSSNLDGATGAFRVVMDERQAANDSALRL